MRKFLLLLAVIIICFALIGCKAENSNIQIAVTTLPVYEFTTALCEGTDIQVTRLITEEVSCLHDYSLQVKQMRAIDKADLIVISGAGLEDFLHDVLTDKHKIVDASIGIPLLCGDPEESNHEHSHKEHMHHQDPHIWLSPTNAALMSTNIYNALSASYPQYCESFKANFQKLNDKFNALTDYANNELSNLRYRSIITFHDGFRYMADAFNLSILHAIEEESGCEASAAELISLIKIVSENKLPAIFTEKNSSGAAASVISTETGVKIFALDMAMSGDSYFAAMYHNIDTLKEALQ